MACQKTSPQGFTLIEIMVVILIIGILAAYFGPNIWGQTNDARVSVARTLFTRSIPTALSGYYLSNPGKSEPTRQQMADRGVPIDPVWNTGAWYFVGNRSASTVSVAMPTGTASSKAQSFENAKTIARSIISDSYTGEIGRNTRIYDISPEHPLIDHVHVKDLAADRMNGVGGIAVWYRIDKMQ